MPKDDRAYLLTRCLKLEARLAKIQEERDALRKLVRLLRKYIPKEVRHETRSSQ
jgi:hypothetical protein